MNRIDFDLKKTIEQQLARHIGPLACMLVERAITHGADLDDVIEILCNELPGEAERDEFRRFLALRV